MKALAAHAPALEIETHGSADRFGALAWSGGALPAVDTAGPPHAYQRIAHTRYGGQVLVQLVYSLWFPERPPQGRFDLLAGALDAVAMRQWATTPRPSSAAATSTTPTRSSAAS